MKRGAVNLTTPCFLELQMIFLSVSSDWLYLRKHGNMKTPFLRIVCLLLFMQPLFAQQPCDIIYVSPAAPVAAGTSSSPTNLTYALTLVSGSRTNLRLLEGVYSLSMITIPANNVKVEGGYRIDGNGNWLKRSDATTTLNFTGFQTNSVSGTTVGNTIGIKATSVSGWTLQDLTIYVATQTGTTSNRGHSAYGIHIESCSNYTINRCVITAGNGTNGNNGATITGTGGAGGGGNGGGGGGQNSGCSGNSGSGGNGGQGNGGASGGAGGSGVGSGGCNIFNCDAEGNNGRNGSGGSSSSNGSGYSAGDRPAANTNQTIYFVPNVQTDGSDGNGGGGGGGGSGGHVGTCCTCGCGSGNASGGSGGNGGSGGLGGNGGLGGGGSFAVYAYGGGSGTIKDCSLTAGSEGIGGTASNGQPGSAGAFGNGGGHHSRCDEFDGGSGGQGGGGGAGGRGRDGANGVSQTIVQYAGAVVSSSGTYPVNPPLLMVNSQNRNFCTNSEINILKTSGSWDLSGTGGAFVNDLTSSTSSYTNTSNDANIYFTTTGNKNIKLNSSTYEGFITVNITRAAPTINALPAAICIGDPVTFGTLSTGINYDWKIYDQNGTQIQAFITQNPGVYIFSSVGTYSIRFRVRTECCGWSIPAYATVDVQAYPIVTLAGLNPSYCLDDAPATLSGTPTGGTFFGTLVSGNIFDPQNAGVGAHEIVYTYETPIGCQRSDTAQTTVLQPPTASFSGLNLDYCINEPGSALTGVPSGGIFTGSGVGGSTFVPFLAGVGAHDVTYTYTSPNGCDAAETKTTIVNDLPILSFTLLPNTYCVDAASVALNALPTGGTYSGVGVSANTFNPAVAGVGGPYVITYTFTDTIGCQNTSSITQSVSVTSLPIVALSGLGTEYCLNATPAILTGLPFGGTFSGTGVTNGIFYPSLAGTGAHTVTYSLTDNNGCYGEQSASTTVQPLPVVSFTGLDPAYCLDAPTAILTVAPAGGAFDGAGMIANSFNAALAGEGGPYDITYTFTDNNNCSSADTQQVTVSTQAVLEIIGLDSLYCAWQGPITLALTPPGGQLAGTGISGSTFNPSVAGAGTHVIVYVYTGGGCSNSITQFVTVDACVGISLPAAPEVKVYPNPTTGKFNVEIFGETISGSVMSIYNMQGQQMMRMQLDAWKKYSDIIDLSEHPKGIYYLRLETGKEVVIKKVILQ